MDEEGGDSGHKIMVDKNDESYYPHYLRETILVYKGCNMVAEVIKNEYGETIESKRIHHNHHHPAIPNYSFEDQEKANRHVKKNNLDQEEMARNPSDDQSFASALKINFIFSGKEEKSQTIIPKGKRTKRINTNKNPNQEHHHHLPNQENLGFLVDQPAVVPVVNNVNNNNNNEGDDGFVLFVEKELTKTDDSDNHQRFSISRNKVNNDKFLTKEELLIMKNKGAVNAVLTDPSGVKYDVKLMIEITGKNCECYKIVKPWNLIRHNNNIHQGALIQLWASRPNNGSDLCFHLVRKN